MNSSSWFATHNEKRTKEISTRIRPSVKKKLTELVQTTGVPFTQVVDELLDSAMDIDKECAARGISQDELMEMIRNHGTPIVSQTEAG